MEKVASGGVFFFPFYTFLPSESYFSEHKENALQYKNSLNRELSFLFVHGLLHLLGYDHMKQEDEEVMFHLQDIILGDKNE